MQNEPGFERSRGEEACLRLFIALRFDAAVRSALCDVAQVLQARLVESKLRWVPAENLHLTLRFLGDVEAARVEELTERVRRRVAQVTPFTFELTTLTLFPSARRPRVIAVGLNGGRALAELAVEVERGVHDAGFPAEERRFRPHITLARLGRAAQRMGVLPADALHGIELPQREQRVSAVEVFRSRLLPTGAVYSSLSRCSLGEKGSSVKESGER